MNIGSFEIFTSVKADALFLIIGILHIRKTPYVVCQIPYH